MSYEENLKRISRKFAVHSPVQYDQIYIDGQPIGHPMMTEKAHEIYCWLAWSLHDLEEVLKARMAADPPLPSWLTGKDPESRKRKPRKKK
jgi:hypothetical protein